MPGAFCLVNAGVGAILSLDAGERNTGERNTGERNTGERNTGELFQKDLMADQPRLWELSAASILLCGLSSVGTICSQPLPRVLLSECFVCFVLQERNYYRVAENHSSEIRSLSRKNFPFPTVSKGLSTQPNQLLVCSMIFVHADEFFLSSKQMD